MSDGNWYVNPDPKQPYKNGILFHPKIRVDWTIIPEIIEQLKNSYEDDSAGRYTNGNCINGTKEIDLDY